MGILPIVGVAVLAYYLAGKTVAGLELGIAALRYKSISLSKLTLSADLEAYNPDKRKTITINELQLEVIYRGNTISTVTKNGLNIPVKPLQKANLKGIIISVNSLQVISELLSLIQNDIEKTMTVKGILTADGLKIPFITDIELTEA